MALTPVPFAISYIWRTGAHPEPGVDTVRSRALAAGAVVGSLFALALAGLIREDGFGFFAAFVAVGVVAWLAIALDQGEVRSRIGDTRAGQHVQRAAFFGCGLAVGAFVGLLPWVAIVIVLRNA